MEESGGASASGETPYVLDHALPIPRKFIQYISNFKSISSEVPRRDQEKVQWGLFKICEPRNNKVWTVRAAGTTPLLPKAGTKDSPLSATFRFEHMI